MTAYIHRWLLLLATTRIYHVKTLPELSTLCPYTQYCTEGPQITDNRQRSCCAPCTCSDLCGLVGTCCPDKVTHNTSYTVYPCLTQQQIYNKYLNITYAGPSNTARFRIVTSCHAQIAEDARQSNFQQHVSRCSKAEKAEDLVFVTGKTSGITYLNKHCAICNGETDYSDWMIAVTKQVSSKDTYTIKDWERYLLSSGTVVSFPRNENDLRSTFCAPTMYSRCNQTGSSDFYSKELEDKCEEYTNTFYNRIILSSNSHKLRSYKNPYCYLCNKQNNYEVVHNCKKILMKYEFSFETFIGRSSSISFSALIVIPREEVNTLENTGKQCKVEEVYELVQERCVQLLCPPGSTPMNGKCEDLIEDVIGFTLAVFFTFTPNDDIDTTRFGQQQLLNELVAQLKEFLNGDESKNCRVCQSRIVKLPSDEYGFLTVIKSTYSCRHLHYIERLSKLFKDAPFQVHSNIFNTSVNLTGTYDTTMFIKGSVFKAGGGTYCQADVVYSDTTFYCPSLEISASDIKASDLHSSMKEELFTQSTNVRNETLRLCLSDYKRILHSSSSFVAPVSPRLCISLALLATTFMVLT